MKTHNFTATVQEGIVSQIDPTTHRIKATIPALEDFETAWLPFLVPNAGGNQFYCLPDKGELVAILLDSRGEGGWVLGAIYNSKDPVPTTDNDIWLKKFSNGTEISHNRKTGEVCVKTNGTVKVQAGKVEIIAPTEITGNVQIKGNLNVSGNTSAGGVMSAPTVSSNGVTLATHTHGGVESGNKRTGTPQ